MNRRQLLTGSAAVLVAPSVARAASLPPFVLPKALAPFDPVGVRTAQGVNGLTPTGTAMFRTLHTIPAGATSIQLGYAGWQAAPGEFAIQPQVWRCKSVGIASGGSGYAVGDAISFTTTGMVSKAPTTLIVAGVSGGVITEAAILIPGIYNAPLGDGVSQTSTSGSGTGATFNMDWEAGAYSFRVGVEPVAGQQVTSGANAIRQALQRGGVSATGFSAGQSRYIYNDPDFFVAGPGLVWTPPIPVNVSPGGVIAVRTWVAGKAPASRPTPSAAQDFGNVQSFWTLTDQSVSGTIGTAAAGQNLVTPAIITGRAKRRVPSILAIGDSITYGQRGEGGTDTGDANGYKGWFERAVTASVAWTNFAASGNKLDYYMNVSSGERVDLETLLQSTTFSAAGVFLSVNDFNAGTSFSALQTQEDQLVQILRGYGVNTVFTATTTPVSNSGNTVPNPTSNDAIQARNTALRGGSHTSGYDFFIDWGTVTESSIGSGLWAASAYGDGTHPSQAGHALMGAYASPIILGRVGLS